MARPPQPKPLRSPDDLSLPAFAAYHRELRRFFLRRVSHPQDASDLLQEVFVRVLSIDRSTLVRNPQAYLYGIAAHVMREHRARKQRERVEFDSAGLEDLNERPGECLGDVVTQGVGLERQIERALAQLSPTHLKVLVADRRDGLSAEEIAARFGLSIHTVRKYLVQALTQVRASWQEHES